MNTVKPLFFMPMDPSIIAQILGRSRPNNNQDPYAVDSSSAPLASDPSNLYGAPSASLQNQNPPPINPNFLPQPGLEQAAQQQGAAPMHPIIASIMQHFGLLNLLRNQNNQTMVDSSQVGNF